MPRGPCRTKPNLAGRLGRSVAVEVADEDVVAFGGQPETACAPEAARGAGHERDGVHDRKIYRMVDFYG